MESVIKLNVNDNLQAPKSSVRSNNNILNVSINNVIEKTFIVNSTSKHITFNRTIEFNNEVYSYIERKVIDVKARLEIDRILQIQKNIYLSFFIISVLGIIISWVPIFTDDISLVLKPLSIAFSLMIILHYHFGRAR